MENLKIIDKRKLLNNLGKHAAKKLCVMVKADAYGHGLERIVELLSGKVDYFGVANLEEALKVRKQSKMSILVVGAMPNLKMCARHDIEFMIDDEVSLKNAIKFGVKDKCHLKINCGMNRFGVSSSLNMKILDDILLENEVKLKSVYTHFPNTTNARQTQENFQRFLQIKSNLTQNPPICFGGSGMIDFPFEFDMLRLGIGLYGYGRPGLEPVLEIKSFVCKTFYAKAGEYVGYGRAFCVEKDGRFAVVPVGYGDGLSRRLSGKICVKIGDKMFPIVGNICMDVFFVKVDESVKVGDEVMVMDDAQYFAKKLGTISYEVLTGFSNFRGKTKIF